jgi:hypothetical protein
MGKTQKIKCTITLCCAHSTARLTELDQLRFLRVNAQSKTAKPLRKYSHNSANILLQFEANNKVIGKTN